MTTEQSEQPTKEKHEWQVLYYAEALFTATVQATDAEEAYALAEKLDFNQFHTNVTGLEELFAIKDFSDAEDTESNQERKNDN